MCEEKGWKRAQAVKIHSIWLATINRLNMKREQQNCELRMKLMRLPTNTRRNHLWIVCMCARTQLTHIHMCSFIKFNDNPFHNEEWLIELKYLNRLSFSLTPRCGRGGWKKKTGKWHFVLIDSPRHGLEKVRKEAKQKRLSFYDEANEYCLIGLWRHCKRLMKPLETVFCYYGARMWMGRLLINAQSNYGCCWWELVNYYYFLRTLFPISLSEGIASYGLIKENFTPRSVE